MEPPFFMHNKLILDRVSCSAQTSGQVKNVLGFLPDVNRKLDQNLIATTTENYLCRMTFIFEIERNIAQVL